jgi:hypothetical protein
MEYKVYKIFDAEDFNRLTKGMKLAQCMGSNSIDDGHASKCIKHVTITGFNFYGSSFCNQIAVLLIMLFLIHCIMLLRFEHTLLLIRLEIN